MLHATPQDVFDALQHRFSAEQLVARRNKGGKGKKNQVDHYSLFFKHIIESDGEYLFVLQFSVTNEGMVLREKEVAGASIAPPQ